MNGKCSSGSASKGENRFYWKRKRGGISQNKRGQKGTGRERKSVTDAA